MLAYLQRRLIYRPKRERIIRVDSSFHPHGELEQVRVPTHDGLFLNGWLYSAIRPNQFNDNSSQASSSPEPQSRPLVLFFSGNAKNRQHRLLNCQNLAEIGADVLLVDYRGYGDNPGSPNEAALVSDAESIWKYALDELNKTRHQIVVYGESLGGGVATQLAARLSQANSPPAGLVLNATFTSLAEAAPHYFRRLPIGWLPLNAIIVDRFASAEHVPHVTSPLLVMHGQHDRYIPVHIGRKLFDAAASHSHCGREKRFIELPHAGHNNIHVVAKNEFQAALTPFFDSIGQTC